MNTNDTTSDTKGAIGPAFARMHRKSLSLHMSLPYT